MSLPSLSLRRPVTALVLNLLILLFGVLGFRRLGVREFPSVDQPVITVLTYYAGATPEIVESQITEPLEKAINGISGIRSIASASNQGSSRITVEFSLSTDLEEAANEVRDKVNSAMRQLPKDIDGPPVVSKSDANGDAIISMTVQSTTRSQLEVNDYATQVLLERLQTIPGVSTVQIWGEKRYAMRLWLDPIKMAAHRVSPNELWAAVERENVAIPSGKVSGLYNEVTLNTLGRLETEAEFNALIIRKEGSDVLRFSDIGKAVLGPDKEESVLKESGIPMVALAVVPQPGTNFIAIADEFYRRYGQLKEEVPDWITLDIALDTTQYVRNSIREVAETLFIAIGLVILIIFLFFRSWKMSLRPLIDIPISLVGTFFVMYLMGYSINVLTLLAIVLATGLVVDDGIVVTENIFKYLERGYAVRMAARLGAEQIYFAVIATSVTLACVFLPIIFMEGFVGRLFREFGVVIATSVLISSFVSLTLTPLITVWLQREGLGAQSSWFYEVTEPFFRGIEQFYSDTLEVFMGFRKGALLFLVLPAGGSVLLFKVLPAELAPLEDRSQFRAVVSAAEGVSYEYMHGFMDQLVSIAKEQVPEEQLVLSVTSPAFFGSGAPNTGFIRIRLVPSYQRERSQQEIVNALQSAFMQAPGGRVFIAQDPTISTSLRVSRPIQFVIQHNQFERLKSVLPRFLAAVRESKILQGADVDLKFNKPELSIRVDRDKASALGITVAEFSSALQWVFSGKRYSYFTRAGKQYEVIGQVFKDFRNESSDIGNIHVKTSSGEMISLAEICEVEETVNPPQRYQFNRYKSATIQADLAPGYALGEGLNEMYAIADSVLDASFSTDLAGMSRDFRESSGNANLALWMALLLVFLVLAIQFESFVDPLVVMVTVPLAFFGALFSLWIFNMTLNIFSEIGIIMLIGLVTKNGILIVEFANQLQRSGKSKWDSVIEASRLRFRPILMTSLATALGALPIAMALGAGAESRKPLGLVVVGGTLFSLILTLYIVPAVYFSFTSSKKPLNDE